ncbi:hypothetical protein [Fusobacterium sp. SYSU M8D902]|uniref:hypothetical protein n=1 Tax=Fusobacterium sp. SYSU M8D902 TaxID=3159562 RepID=UPI0032E4ECDA
MAKNIFSIDNQEYTFDYQKFDYQLIIEKDRNFFPSIIKIEKEEKNYNNDGLYIITSKIYIDDYFVKKNFKKLIDLKILRKV